MQFSIESWAAYSQGTSSQEEWKKWALKDTLDIEPSEETPNVKFLPMMMRRRLGLLSKMSFFVLNQLDLQIKHPLIFASRHGDSSATNQILEKLSQTSEISPAEFSLSVHNSCPGQYAIHTQNNLPYTAIAAGHETFQMGLLEAISTSDFLKKPVILLYVENDLNPKFQKYIQHKYPPHAIATVIKTHHEGQLDLHQLPTSINSTKLTVPSLNFLKWFLNPNSSQFELKNLMIQKC